MMNWLQLCLLFFISRNAWIKSQQTCPLSGYIQLIASEIGISKLCIILSDDRGLDWFLISREREFL